MEMNQDKWRIPYEGTAQSERYLSALMPSNIRVDARDLHEFIDFCVQTANSIKYFNLKNEEQGTWAQFFEKDPSIFFALRANDSPQSKDDKVRALTYRYYQTQEETRKEILHSFAQILIEMVSDLDVWYVDSMAQLATQGSNKALEVLQKSIDSLAENTQSLWNLLKAIGKEEALNNLHPSWKLNKEELPDAEFSNEGQGLNVAFEKMRQIFQTFHFHLVYLHQKALDWLKESLANRNDHEPYVGLLLSFLHLFLHVQNQLNAYPQKHLDHYYFDWLRQKAKPHLLDRSIISFQLADQITTYPLKKNTLLLAGVNEEGLASLYSTTEDVLLSDTRIAELKTLFVSKAKPQQVKSSYQLVGSIYAAPFANSKDGNGAPFESKEQDWPIFGEEQLNIPFSDRQMVDARVGFVIAAPILSLKEGDREIKIEFRFTAASFSVFTELVNDIGRNTQKKFEEVLGSLLSDALNLYVSTETGWFQIKRWKVDAPKNWINSNSITLSLYLGNEDPSIVDNLPDVLGESFDTSWPLLKLELNPDHNLYLYSFVSSLELEMITLDITVVGLKSLTLINEVGLIDSSAPFLPFGPIPKPNAYLLIGCQELFKKRLTELSIHIDWDALPDLEGGLEEHYRGYPHSIDNNSYQIQVSALSGASFQPRDPQAMETFPLFVVDEHSQLQTKTKIDQIELPLLRIKPDYLTKTLSEYSNNIKSGYIKLQLKGPKMAFGHTIYPQLFAKAMIEQALAQSGFLARLSESSKEIILPKEPFTPQIYQLRINYTAKSRLNFMPMQAEENDEFAAEKVFVLHPFGKLEVFTETKAIERQLFPIFPEDAYLYIGLERAKPNEVLNLFFQLRESNHVVYTDNLEIKWSYLYLNNWEPFPTDALLADHTKQFTTSGITKLRLPNEIQLGNSLMPSGRFWLRIAASGNLDIVGRVLSIQSNAAEVVWVDNGDPRHFDPQIPRSPIQGLFQATPEIASVIQTIGYYGDRPAELPRELYVRVSERLRHKNRAINNWDIEHLILEQFPELRQVKCIGATRESSVSPGHITVVVVPKATEKTLEPMLGFNQLETITEFVKEKLSPFVHLKVINPRYEKIKVSANVLLTKELMYEQGAYLQLLHEELMQEICPWLHSGKVPLGGQINKNKILDFLNSRPYLKFVSSFSLAHIFESAEEFYVLRDTAQEQIQDQVIYASTSWSVFVPVPQHNIQFITGPDNSDPTRLAIEGMRLGTDFIVIDDQQMLRDGPGLNLVEGEKKEKKTTWYLFPKSD